jgi:metal-responsive CopG/Arc/MetJ family transcriptional regulator
MKTIAITMDEDMLKRVDQISSNRSSIVRQAVDEYLSRVEREGEEEREKAILRKHRGKLSRQTAELVKGQAKS